MNKLIDELKFDDKGLIPVVVQDYKSDEVLMVAYMNLEAFERTMETGKAHYWSRSRQKLWLKGETSGHFQYVKAVKLDCDGDTLLLQVEQVEAACHTGHYSCFYRELDGDRIRETKYKTFDPDKVYGEKPDEVKDEKAPSQYNTKSKILDDVYNVIVDRTINPKEGSYTNYLFEKGLDKMLKKVGEETSEVIIAAKNKNKDELRYEIGDLLYHLLVVMVERGLKPDDVYDELEKRR